MDGRAGADPDRRAQSLTRQETSLDAGNNEIGIEAGAIEGCGIDVPATDYLGATESDETTFCTKVPEGSPEVVREGALTKLGRIRLRWKHSWKQSTSAPAGIPKSPASSSTLRTGRSLTNGTDGVGKKRRFPASSANKGSIGTEEKELAGGGRRVAGGG